MDDAFRYRCAAQQLGIPYTAIDDTPLAILESAWEDWDCLRDYERRLQFQLLQYRGMG